ncbi:glycosyltransferase [Myceligenerans pegani]|uniref:Glycosyltransferase n=1 Tax=Myceligenerans pegani TaxID=2776917 RepID=A0ABR9N545_9MICO|nr:glycosyltransferase [Myceligenerans sp. TRM 65318]MBE1878773.1 glycosyltransferase [Myceligenerans sp. TRM 65318]MBE3021044.1 glycosyltransferase [Myceligenerans sp. TRM 65318]
MTGEGDRRPASEMNFGTGPLARVTNAIYWYLVTGVLMIVAALPGALPIQFLESSPGNAPVLALCLAPLAPAFAAGLFALRDRKRADALTPARSFLRGYRLNWADALRMAIPGLIFVAIGGLGAGVVGDGGALAGDGVSILAAVPEVYLGMLIVVGAVLALWTMNAMVISALFSFRVQDVARLAAYYLFARWRVTLGGLSLVVLGAAILLLAGDFTFGAVAVLWTGAVLRNHRALTRDVEERFTAPANE